MILQRKTIKTFVFPLGTWERFQVTDLPALKEEELV